MHAVLLVLLLLLLYVFALVLHLLLCLLLLHARMIRPCMMRVPIRGRTRLGLQGPTGTRRVKGGVSDPAEDLRPVSEVQAGVNFRPAGDVRGQVAGSPPWRQPGTGTRQVKGSVVTPSLHPEVAGIQFVSPGYGLDIRQSMGWTKVCGTAQSGIRVLKGNARTCMFPANLDHLRVGWRKQGSYKTAWVTPGHDCLCSYKYGHGAAVRPQTNNAIWDGDIGLWGRVDHLFVGIAITSPCSAHRVCLSLLSV